MLGHVRLQGRPIAPTPRRRRTDPFWVHQAHPTHFRAFKPTTPRERIVVLDGEVQVECELGRFHLSGATFWRFPRVVQR